MEKSKNGWTEAYEAISKEMKAVTEERIKFRELKANNLILFTENEHLKTLNEQAEEQIVLLRRERNFWHEMATKGGGHD